MSEYLSKEDLSYSLALATKIESINNQYLCILTSAGCISGTVNLFPDSCNALSSLQILIKSSYKNAKQNNLTFSDKPTYILLNDATLVNGSMTVHYNELVVFTDQIIGISVSNASV